MRNLPKLLFQRVIVVTLAIALQIGVILAGALWLQDYRWWMNAVLSALSWVAVLVILSGQSNSSYKIAWVILILAFPVAGLTIYLLFGGNKASSRENRKMQQIDGQVMCCLRQDEEALAAVKALPGPAYDHARYLLRSARCPIYDNSGAEYFSDGDPCWKAMLRELEKAEHYIFLEFFIINHGKMWSSILEILQRKALAGVDVRVLYDDFGCIVRLPGNYCKTLRAMGIQACVFNPYVPVISARLNNRDHRKLLIVDGKTAFTGGVNLSDEYINLTHPYGRWKDCGILVKGEAAWSMTVMFLSMWDYVAKQTEDVAAFEPFCPDAVRGEHGYLQPFCDSPLDYEDVGATIFQQLIQTARETVFIMTPYLILDEKMSSALCVAAKTGVDVRIITPGIPDKWYVHAVTRANYEVLTEAGVRVFEYRPGFIHSKVCLADSESAVVGTVNMDFRSLYLHFEDAVYLTHTETTAQIAQDFAETFPQCREITYARCRHVHFYQRVVRALLRMFSPLM
jgi:cardiolipin synthase